MLESRFDRRTSSRIEALVWWAVQEIRSMRLHTTSQKRRYAVYQPAVQSTFPKHREKLEKPTRRQV